MRAVWGLVWLFLFRFSPKPLHFWRAWILRLFGADIGEHVHVYPNVKIWAPWQLQIGSNVGIANGVIIYNMATVSIGSHAVVSQGTHLCAGSHDFNSPNFQLIASPITVGSRVWLCAETFVGPGVVIAEGCVVGARALVVKSINNPWEIWVGVPAVKVGDRNKNKVLSNIPY